MSTPSDGMVSLVDTAALLGRSYSTLARWARAGRIAGLRRDARGKYLVPVAVALALVQTGKRPPVQEQGGEASHG